MSASRASVLLHAGSQGNKEKGEKVEDLKGVIKNFITEKNLNAVYQNSESLVMLFFNDAIDQCIKNNCQARETHKISS